MRRDLDAARPRRRSLVFIDLLDEPHTEEVAAVPWTAIDAVGDLRVPLDTEPTGASTGTV
jgi:hypothetical protein